MKIHRPRLAITYGLKILVAVAVTSPIPGFGIACAAELDMWVSIYRGQNNVFYCINPSTLGSTLQLDKAPIPTEVLGCETNHADGQHHCQSNVYPQQSQALNTGPQCYLATCYNPENLNCTHHWIAYYKELVNQTGAKAIPRSSGPVYIGTNHENIKICATRTAPNSVIKFNRWVWGTMNPSNSGKITRYGATPSSDGDLPCIVASCTFQGADCGNTVELFWDEYLQ